MALRLLAADGEDQEKGYIFGRGEFVKYPKIPAIDLSSLRHFFNKEVTVFEKIDGGLTQVRRIGHRVLPGSKARVLQGDTVDKVPWFKSFVSWQAQQAGFYHLPHNLVVFGEWLSHHSIKYDERNENHFYLLDLFDMSAGKFWDYEDSTQLMKTLDIDVRFLKVLAKGHLNMRQLEDLVLKQGSAYRDGPKEGIVIKDYRSDPQDFWKVYHPKFEINRMKDDGTVDFTNSSRIENGYFAYVEEHGPLEDSEKLIDFIYQDTVQETGREQNREELKREVYNFLRNAHLMPETKTNSRKSRRKRRKGK